MSYDDDDSSSEGGDDPLSRLMRMAEEEDREGEAAASSGRMSGPLGPKPSTKGTHTEDSGGDSDGPQDPLSRFADFEDDDTDDEDEEDNEANKEIVARIIASRLAAADKGEGKSSSYSNRDDPQDPLSRIADMEDGTDDEEEDNEANKEIIARIIASRMAAVDEGEGKPPSNSNRGDPLARIMRIDKQGENEEEEAPVPHRQEVEKPDSGRYPHVHENEPLTASEKEIVARIVAIRMAQIDDDAPDSSWNRNPEDPLERIMNMNAEEQLLSAASLIHYSVAEDDSDEEDYDDIIRKKDFRNLNKMIQENDLEELERQVAAMADSVRTKLTASTLADLSRNYDSTLDSDAGLGYAALAMGGHKEVINQSHVMTSLDISKITSDDDGDGRFVSMSDSILDSSVKINIEPIGGRKSELLGGTNASDNDSIQSSERGKALIAHYTESPSKAENKLLSSNFNVNSIRGIDLSSSPISPKKNLPKPKKSTSQQWDDPVQSKSVFISDWWGVLGDFAGIRSDWSDSQSTMSYTESVLSDSVASLGASTQTEDYDTPVAEISGSDTLTAKALDQFLGLSTARDSGSTSGGPGETKQKPVHHSLSLLEQKRRRKRELEAWRASLSTSFQTDS